MEDKTMYKDIVGTDIKDTDQSKQESTRCIDDVTDIVGSKDKDNLEIYINELYSLLKAMYGDMKLQMNCDKTSFITIESHHNKYETRKLEIKVDENTTIEEDEELKILGFQQNRRNIMDSQINAISSKVAIAMKNLRPAIPFMMEKKRKEIVQAKIKPIALYGIQLMLS